MRNLKEELQELIEEDNESTLANFYAKWDTFKDLEKVKKLLNLKLKTD